MRRYFVRRVAWAAREAAEAAHALDADGKARLARLAFPLQIASTAAPAASASLSTLISVDDWPAAICEVVRAGGSNRCAAGET